MKLSCFVVTLCNSCLISTSAAHTQLFFILLHTTEHFECVTGDQMFFSLHASFFCLYIVICLPLVSDLKEGGGLYFCVSIKMATKES